MTSTYGCDWVYRLTSELRRTNGSGALVYDYLYEYDPLSNRTQKTDNGVSVTYTYDANNRLVSAGNTTYDYDGNGNLWHKRTGSQVTTFEYDYENNLVTWTPPTGPANTFIYNSSGERIQKQDSRGITRFLFAGGLLQELDSAGQVRTWYNPGISQTTSTGKTFFHYNHLGSTVRMTTTAGLATADNNVYDAWGNRVSSPGPTFTPFMFVGKEGYCSDPDTGLMLLGCRYYDATIGRFITPDPDRDGLNWYGYADGNPVMNIDPDGQKPKSVGYFQTALDVGGMLPVVGPAFDLANAAISLAYGEYVDAAMSAASAVPVIGDTATMAKYANRTVKSIRPVVKPAKKLAKSMAKSAAKGVARKSGRKSIGKVARNGIDWHHPYPRQFRKQFERAGIDIDEYVYPLRTSDHRLKPDGLHTGKDNVNALWGDFFNNNENPTKEEIEAFGRHIYRLKGK